MMGIEYTAIKLKCKWMGHPKGAELKLNSVVAETLINRKAAVLSKNGDEPTVIGKGAVDKDVASPPKDKMMRPVKRKGGKRLTDG